MGSDPNHYSYAAYADPAMAAGFDAARFGGPIGRLVFEDQERVLLGFLDALADARVLDVGTGTGRAAIALARQGAHVTGVDASAEMLAMARRRAAQERLAIDFVEGDAHALRFADKSFDSVVCLRMLMHVPDWRASLAEVCRVTRRRLVIDYPSLTSSAALQATWRRVVSGVGGHVEAYRVFSDRDIDRALGRNGFRVTDRHRQFVLPIALHKLVGSASFTRRIEGALSGIGLLRLVGSPVTIAAERCGS